MLARIDIQMKHSIIITTIGPMTMAHPPPAAPARRPGNGKGTTFACDYHLSGRFYFHWKASRAAHFKVTGHQLEDFPKKKKSCTGTV